MDDTSRDLVPFVQFKKRVNLPGGLLFLVCNFTKSNTLPWVFFAFLKIAQVVPNRVKHLIRR